MAWNDDATDNLPHVMIVNDYATPGKERAARQARGLLKPHFLSEKLLTIRQFPGACFARVDDYAMIDKPYRMV
jgi:hypothetical protein